VDGSRFHTSLVTLKWQNIWGLYNPPFSVGPIHIIHCRSGSPAYPTALNVAFVVEASPAKKKNDVFLQKKKHFLHTSKWDIPRVNPSRLAISTAKIWKSGATHWI